MRKLEAPDIFDGTDDLSLGVELVTDGDFPNGTNWTIEPPSPTWVITGGEATIDGTQTSGKDLSQSISLTQNKYYLLQVDVNRYVTGNVVPYLNGTAGPLLYGLGTHKAIIQAGASGGLVFTASTTYDADIDNVTVKEILSPANLSEIGGTVSGWFKALSDGENNLGTILDTSAAAGGYWVYLASESSGKCAIGMGRAHTATNGSWYTANTAITLNDWTFFAISLTDGAGNQPTFYLGNNGILSKLTVGSGLTEGAATAGAARGPRELGLSTGGARVGQTALRGFLSSSPA